MTDINNLIEYFGAVAALLYVFLEIKQKHFMWIVGGFSSAIYIFVFLKTGLYAAACLQVYFLVISVYGWIKWKKGEKRDEQSEIIALNIPLKKIVVSLILSLIAYFGIAYILEEFSHDPAPRIDSLITVLSMLATYWLSQKFIEQWFLWIIVNALSVSLYISQGLYPTSILYFVYLVASFIGYIHWRKYLRALL